MSLRRLLTALLFAPALFWAGAWLHSHRAAFRSQAPTLPGSYHGYDVVLITIDTLRADHLPAYGYRHVETPALDALAAESIAFENAISPIPLTLPAHTTMLTSLDPPTHGIPDNGTWVVDTRLTTLPELLSARGYATGAFVSSFVLDSRWQLNKGFATYYDSFNVPDFNLGEPGLLQRPGGETEAEAERWLEAHKDGPFFLWLHLYDPHQPYAAPEPFRSRYATNPYDAEIAYADSVVGRFVSKLRDLGRLERTVLLLTSDHGESLGEHGERTHGLLVYESTQHVPLFIRLPGGKGQRVAGVVRHVDLAPTILDWLGLPVPKAMQGKSLAPLIEGTEKEPRLAYSESRYSSYHYGWAPLFALTSLRYKLIRAPQPELYDRIEDPGERRNLYASEPLIAQELGAELDGLLARIGLQNAGVRGRIDTDTEERLRALGYLGASIEDPKTMPEAIRATDPKDKVRLHDLLNDASIALLDRKDDEAERIVRQVLAEDPQMTEAHYCAGVIAVRRGRYDEAIAAFRKVLEGQPRHLKALYNLGTTYQGAGTLELAEVSFRAALRVDPKHLPSIVHLAHLYRQRGDGAQARNYFLEAAALYRTNLETARGAGQQAEARARLAEVLFKAGDKAEAELQLRRAIELLPTRPTLHYNLALVLEDKGDWDGAVAAYRAEIAGTSRNYRALRGLGVALAHQGRIDDALAAFEQVLDIQPDDAETYYWLADALAREGKNLPEARSFAENAVRLAPQSKEARALLAALEKRGRRIVGR